MLGRKKKIPEQKEPNYENWEKELGFLTLILTRKKNITKEYLIGIFSNQIKDVDFLRDEDIEPIVSKVVTEVMSQIGEKYKSFIIEKYFGDEKSLLAFITEDVYIDLTTDAINRNNNKIQTAMQKSLMNKIQGLRQIQ